MPPRNPGNRAEQAHILVVDDQDELLDSLCELLRLEGYQVDAARGGRKALDLLKANDYDAVLLDLRMPDISGHDVLNHISAELPGLQTIVVSGETSFDDVKECLREGAYDYIRKPYVPDEILTTLKNALKTREILLRQQQLEFALRDSERLHRYIVNNSPDIVYMLDESGCFTFVNDTLSKLLQYDRDDLIGKHYSLLVHEDDLEIARYIFNERRTGARATRNAEIRLRSRNPSSAARYFDTHILPVELNSTGIYNSQTGKMKGSFMGTYGVARDVTHRKQTEQLINYQAYHDLLTGLPNRALFNDRLHQAIAHARRVSGLLAVMFLDLDRFKIINDSLGHAIGDQLLKAVTQRLNSCLRDEDTLCRFGGDEFTLLLPDIRERKDAGTIAQKILNEMAAPFVIDGHELYVTTSIGIAIYPDAGEELETLCQKADIAMYYVKANGKDSFQYFNEDMNLEFTSRVTLERELRLALEQEQFHMFFQPKISSASGEIVGMESLIRWHHPIRGLVLPGEFIQLAEDTNLIVPIGNWALQASCAEMARWNGHSEHRVRVSVNVSPRQLEQADFVRFVLDTLQQHGIAGEQLELEITESTIVHNKKNVIQKLLALSRHGIRIAIDDFGMGYSSLSYLQQFPIHTLKIDRNFVSDINHGQRDACIVDAIIALGKGLDLHLVAEGVETHLQLEYLKRLGCTEVQGHLFATAQPGSQISALLENGLLYYSGLADEPAPAAH